MQVLYSDGDEEVLDLHTEKWQMVDEISPDQVSDLSAEDYITATASKNPIYMPHTAGSGPREDATRIGSTGVVRRHTIDISPLRRVNQAIYLLTTQERISENRVSNQPFEAILELARLKDDDLYRSIDIFLMALIYAKPFDMEGEKNIEVATPQIVEKRKISGQVVVYRDWLLELNRA
ncbi:hypothetical protein M8C21_033599 [Ambrosia artemisiifolia]|uniref:Uncharacterized protein n=1 Tax=Ambrosia artemisiifolia TaxID=4212 RepID=A0AAD5GCB3_AMBAR|nr:hypothetical protein M8C21_033599 [Ambrosia artemisiifolia]